MSNSESSRSSDVQRILQQSSPHAILGVSPGASHGEIRRAYLRLSTVVHPDKCSSPQAHEAFVRMSGAYKTLAEGAPWSHGGDCRYDDGAGDAGCGYGEDRADEGCAYDDDPFETFRRAAEAAFASDHDHDLLRACRNFFDKRPAPVAVGAAVGGAGGLAAGAAIGAAVGGALGVLLGGALGSDAGRNSKRQRRDDICDRGPNIGRGIAGAAAGGLAGEGIGTVVGGALGLLVGSIGGGAAGALASVAAEGNAFNNADRASY